MIYQTKNTALIHHLKSEIIIELKNSVYAL